MTQLTKPVARRHFGASTLAGLALLSCLCGGWSQAAPAKSATDRTAVFDMDGRQIIQDEAHLGIVNGKLTAGINYRNVAGLGEGRQVTHRRVTNPSRESVPGILGSVGG